MISNETDHLPPLFEDDEPDHIDRFADEYRFLSNFQVVPGGVTARGMTAPTTEHLYQALKTEDPEEQQTILELETPGKAKRAGRKVHVRPDWDLVKLGIMADLQAAKYQNPALAALLRDTGDTLLIEGNHWHDTFWGQCTCDRHRCDGENWLGKILMLERSRLAAP